MIRIKCNLYVKKMQKFIIVLCAVLMIVISFTGCTKKNDTELTLLQIENALANDVDSATDSVTDSVTEADEVIEEQVVRPTTICVHVCGAVNIPGVYELPDGSRIYEAIDLSGGFADNACKDYVNLAQTVSDGTQIVIPTIQEVEDGSVFLQNENAHETEESGPVNINTADVTRLCTLPGIGEAKAEAIINYRKQIGQFETIEQIMEVEGIKVGMYSKIQDKICVK